MVRRALLPLSVAALAAVVAAAVPVGGAGAAETKGVMVRDSSFSPANLTMHSGDTVVFARVKGTQLVHSVTSDAGLFDVEINDQRTWAALQFREPGTYAYHCKYHGGSGMTGVIAVEDAGATTTTTAPGPTTTTTPTTGPTSTTTTTAPPPTTTTTKPPKPPKTTTTTAPPPPTTTAPPPPPPAWEPPPPPPPPPPSSGATAPPPTGRPAAPPTTTRPAAPVNPRDRTAAAGTANGKAPPPAPPTTDTTAAPVPPPDPAALATAEAAAAAAAAPPPEVAPPPAADPPVVEDLDPAILDTLASASEKPPDNGSRLLVGSAVALGLFLLGAGAWAWYHRSSRYMPA